jgi:hypothetical protein
MKPYPRRRSLHCRLLLLGCLEKIVRHNYFFARKASSCLRPWPSLESILACSPWGVGMVFGFGAFSEDIFFFIIKSLPFYEFKWFEKIDKESY